MSIRHLLLDADGVLQHLPGDWRDRFVAIFGDEADAFIAEAWAVEKPSLVGGGDFVGELRTLLGRYGDPVTAEELHASIWTTIEQVESSLALVPRLRAAGYGVHLGTNQAPLRADHMRHDLGYDDLFDVSVYSCDLGVAKPDPRYFARAVELIGAVPGEVLFVDDRAENVDGARAAGLPGVGWTFTEGLAEFESRLAAHGVTLPR